jgi:hypothetical protein
MLGKRPGLGVSGLILLNYSNFLVQNEPSPSRAGEYHAPGLRDGFIGLL